MRNISSFRSILSGLELNYLEIVDDHDSSCDLETFMEGFGIYEISRHITELCLRRTKQSCVQNRDILKKDFLNNLGTTFPNLKILRSTGYDLSEDIYELDHPRLEEFSISCVGRGGLLGLTELPALKKLDLRGYLCVLVVNSVQLHTLKAVTLDGTHLILNFLSLKQEEIILPGVETLKLVDYLDLGLIMRWIFSLEHLAREERREKVVQEDKCRNKSGGGMERKIY